MFPTGLLEQVKLAYAGLTQVLGEFGATLDNVVDETFFVTNVEELMASVEPVYTARQEAYGGFPEVAQTVIQIGALVDPRCKIEIKCIASL